MGNPESSHVRMGWISVISVDFSVISVDSSVISLDFKWFQLIPVWFQISLLWNHTAVWFQIYLLWNHTAVWFQIPLLWNHTAVWFQISLLWNHTESHWIILNHPESHWITLNHTEITLNHTEIMLNQTEWFRVLTLVLKGNPTVNLWDFSWITSINSLVGVFCWIITRFGRCTPFTRDDSAEHTFQLVDISDSGNITLVYRWDFQYKHTYERLFHIGFVLFRQSMCSVFRK